MDATEAEGLGFFQKTIEGLEHKGRDLYIGRCPACGRRELRVFKRDFIEVRCASCTLWTFGVTKFISKAAEMGFPIGPPTEKSKTGICKICEAPFPYHLNVRRPQEYCSPRCRKRAERARKRGIS